ncbi:MAG: hypothetical protein C5B57_10350 [Blastocatellia bacterium]|nr:MAG: hypothetical protein C5B57_10350 [Blastocatellia bacterium]
MLSFLSPLFLLGAAAAAVPIILHLLKREPEPRIKFAAVKLLKDAPVEYTETRRIREWLLLALRVAALLFLAVAFARPYLASGAAIGRAGVTMIAIDTSFSMSPARTFERAKQLAKAALDRVPSGDLVGVMTFADVAAVVRAPSLDRALAAAAIDAATPGFGPTRYRSALNVAAQSFAGRRGAIVMVTDLQQSGWEGGDRAAVPDSTRIELADVGPPPPNLAVTALSIEGERIVASIHNSADETRETRVAVTLDGRPGSDQTTTIAANGSAIVDFPADASVTAASVAVEDREGLQADNVRYLVRDGGARSGVLVVTANGDLDREAFYVKQVLSASASDTGRLQVAATSPATLATSHAPQLSGSAVVVLLSSRGLDRRGREALANFVRNGGGLLLAAGPEVDGDVVADIFAGQPRLGISTSIAPAAQWPKRSLVAADTRHPLFEAFGSTASALGLVTFQRIARIDAPGCQTVARFTTGEAALLDCSPGEGRALVFASDFDNRWSDFPRHATFVPFVQEAVRYVTSGRPLRAEYLIGQLPPGVAATPGIVTAPDAMLARGQRGVKIAVNVDPRESDPTRISVDEFQAAVTRLKDIGASESRVDAEQRENRQRLWQYAMGLMCAILAVEGIVASRTA